MWSLRSAPWTNIPAHTDAGSGGGGECWGRGSAAQPAPPRRGRDCTLHTNATTTVTVPSPEQIMISLRSYHLFNINEIFNEVTNCRLISPSLISTGEI